MTILTAEAAVDSPSLGESETKVPNLSHEDGVSDLDFRYRRSFSTVDVSAFPVPEPTAILGIVIGLSTCFRFIRTKSRRRAVDFGSTI